MARANWVAVISLVVAILSGSYVNGIFPGQDGNPLGGWGIGTVEAWVLAALLYFERARRGAADVRERAAGRAKRPLPLARGFGRCG